MTTKKLAERTEFNARFERAVETLKSKAGVKQKDIAERLAIAPSSVTALISGKSKTASKQTLRLMELNYGVSQQWLESGEGGMFMLTPAVSQNDITYFRDFHVWVLVAGFDGWARLLTYYALSSFPPKPIRIETVQKAMSWVGTPHSWQTIPLRTDAEEAWNTPLMVLKEKLGLPPVAYLMVGGDGGIIHIGGSADDTVYARGVYKIFDTYWEPIPIDEDLEAHFQMSEEEFKRLFLPDRLAGSKR